MYFQVQYKVGEVVRWTEGKVTGVIVGWDEKAKFPAHEMYEEKIAKHKDLPHYLIVMDSTEAQVVYDQLRYLAQPDIELVEPPKRIFSMAVSKYFEHFHNGRYLMRPWLQQIYPRG